MCHLPTKWDCTPSCPLPSCPNVIFLGHPMLVQIFPNEIEFTDCFVSNGTNRQYTNVLYKIFQSNTRILVEMVKIVIKYCTKGQKLHTVHENNRRNCQNEVIPCPKQDGLVLINFQKYPLDGMTCILNNPSTPFDLHTPSCPQAKRGISRISVRLR